MVANQKQKKRSKPLMVGLSVVLLMSLISVSIMMLWRQTRRVPDTAVVKDIQTLQNVFKKIQKDCYITGFEHSRNYIDFLNVISFVGSRVGSMNLAYAKNWQGPYLKNNPTIQEKFYVVLKNKQGHFIVPGDGVRLSNGKVIGRDIILDESTNMLELLQSPDGLLSRVGALAVPITIGSNLVGSMLHSPELVAAID